MADTELNLSLDAKAFIAGAKAAADAIEGLRNATVSAVKGITDAIGGLNTSATSLNFGKAFATQAQQVAQGAQSMSRSMQAAARATGHFNVVAKETPRAMASVARATGHFNVVAKETPRVLASVARATSFFTQEVKSVGPVMAVATRAVVGFNQGLIRLGVSAQEATAKVIGFSKAAAGFNQGMVRLGVMANAGALATQTAFQKMEMSIRSASSRIRTEFSLTRNLFLLGFVGGAVGGAFKFAGDFEKSLANVSTLLGNADVPISRYKNQLIELNKASSKDLLDITKGLYQTISAGIPAIEGAGGAFDVLKASVKAAEAGLSTTEQAVNATVTVLNSYKQANLSATEVTDKLLQTVVVGRITFDQLANSLGLVITNSANAGVTLDEMLGAVAALTNAGLTSSRTMTSLNAAFTALQPTSKKVRKLFKDIGVDATTTGIRTQGFTKQLKLIKEAVDKDPDLLVKLFRRDRAKRAITALLGDMDSFLTRQDKIAKAAGATDKAFQKFEGTLARTIAKFKAKYQSVLIEIAEERLPNLVNKISVLGESLVENQGKIGAFFVSLYDGLVAVGKFIAANGKSIAIFFATAFVVPKVAALISAFGIIRDALATLRADLIAFGAVTTRTAGASAGVTYGQGFAVGLARSKELVLGAVTKLNKSAIVVTAAAGLAAGKAFVAAMARGMARLAAVLLSPLGLLAVAAATFGEEIGNAAGAAFVRVFRGHRDTTLDEADPSRRRVARAQRERRTETDRARREAGTVLVGGERLTFKQVEVSVPSKKAQAAIAAETKRQAAVNKKLFKARQEAETKLAKARDRAAEQREKETETVKGDQKFREVLGAGVGLTPEEVTPVTRPPSKTLRKLENAVVALTNDVKKATTIVQVSEAQIAGLQALSRRVAAREEEPPPEEDKDKKARDEAKDKKAESKTALRKREKLLKDLAKLDAEAARLELKNAEELEKRKEAFFNERAERQIKTQTFIEGKTAEEVLQTQKEILDQSKVFVNARIAFAKAARDLDIEEARAEQEAKVEAARKTLKSKEELLRAEAIANRIFQAKRIQAATKAAEKIFKLEQEFAKKRAALDVEEVKLRVRRRVAALGADFARPAPKTPSGGEFFEFPGGPQVRLKDSVEEFKRGRTGDAGRGVVEFAEQKAGEAQERREKVENNLTTATLTALKTSRDVAEGGGAIVAGALEGDGATVLGGLAQATTDIPFVNIVTQILAIVGQFAAVADSLVEFLETGLYDFLKSLPEAVSSILIAVAENIGPLILLLVAETIPNIIQAVIGALPEIIAGIIKAIPQIVAAFIALIPEIVVAIVEGIADAFKSIVDFDLSGADSFFGDLFGFYHGGVVRGGTSAGGAMAGAFAAAGAPGLQTGGLIGRLAGPLGRDNVPILAAQGEAVLNRTAVGNLGEAGVHQLNSGQVPGSGSSPVVNVSLSGPLAPLSNFINATVSSSVSNNKGSVRRAIDQTKRTPIMSSFVRRT